MKNKNNEKSQLYKMLQENLNYELSKKEKELFEDQNYNLMKNINNLSDKQVKYGQSIIIGYILTTIENTNCSVEDLKGSLLTFIDNDKELNEYTEEIKKIYNNEIYMK